MSLGKNLKTQFFCDLILCFDSGLAVGLEGSVPASGRRLPERDRQGPPRHGFGPTALLLQEGARQSQ